MYILSALIFLPLLYANPCPPHKIYFKNSKNEDQLCSTICPPAKTQDVDLRFCRTNCAAFYACQLDLFSSCPATSMSYDTSCDGQPAPYFYHTKEGFCSCASACNHLDEVCQENCPGYFDCMKRKQMDLQTAEVTQTSPNRNTEDSPTTAKLNVFHSTTTTTSVDDSASSNYDLIHFIVIPVCAVVTVVFFVFLGLYLRRRNQCSKGHPTHQNQKEVDILLGTLSECRNGSSASMDREKENGDQIKRNNNLETPDKSQQDEILTESRGDLHKYSRD